MPSCDSWIKGFSGRSQRERIFVNHFDSVESTKKHIEEMQIHRLLIGAQITTKQHETAFTTPKSEAIMINDTQMTSTETTAAIFVRKNYRMRIK